MGADGADVIPIPRPVCEKLVDHEVLGRGHWHPPEDQDVW